MIYRHCGCYWWSCINFFFFLFWSGSHSFLHASLKTHKSTLIMILWVCRCMLYCTWMQYSERKDIWSLDVWMSPVLNPYLGSGWWVLDNGWRNVQPLPITPSCWRSMGSIDYRTTFWRVTKSLHGRGNYRLTYASISCSLTRDWPLWGCNSGYCSIFIRWCICHCIYIVPASDWNI